MGGIIPRCERSGPMSLHSIMRRDREPGVSGRFPANGRTYRAVPFLRSKTGLQPCLVLFSARCIPEILDCRAGGGRLGHDPTQRFPTNAV